jgi:hypothetical protein
MLANGIGAGEGADVETTAASDYGQSEQPRLAATLQHA